MSFENHVALSFHSVREGIVAGITSSFWLREKLNIIDIMTKQIVAKEFLTRVDNKFWSVSQRRLLLVFIFYFDIV